jgi:hypothetical protein
VKKAAFFIHIPVILSIFSGSPSMQKSEKGFGNTALALPA